MVLLEGLTGKAALTGAAVLSAERSNSKAISTMKFISYNVNGIRAALKKGFLEWLEATDPDVIGLQETKATQDQVPAEAIGQLEALGYHHVWHSAEKKGYSGVATFSKQVPDLVQTGCGIERFDCEGRVLRTDFGDLSFVNVYFPSGSSGDLRQEVKYDFLENMQAYATELRRERPHVIFVGDYNIAHTEHDIHNPKGLAKSSGFLPEERQWMSDWLAAGFYDAYRLAHPDAREVYSWWSYRAGARQRNKGWRIDYQCVTEGLRDQVIDVQHHKEVLHSDHAAVEMELDWGE